MLVDAPVHSNVLCETYLSDAKNAVSAFPRLLSPTSTPNWGDYPYAVDQPVADCRFGTSNLTFVWRRSQKATDQALRLAAVKL